MAVVSLNKVSKAFGSHVAVNDLSLDIIQGEFLTLLGPSGCGKTTVLRLMAGLETCDAGQIFIQGKDHTQIPACHRNVNTVFQSYALFPHMDVFDNIAFGLSLKKEDKKKIKTRVKDALAMVRLSGLENRKINQLSGGQQQRVGIARALAVEPDLLLMDEPFSALDAMTRRSLQDEIRRIWEETRTTILFVTHDVEEAVLLADRIILLAGSPATAVEEYRPTARRPRRAEDGEFQELCRRIRSDLYAYHSPPEP